MLDGGYPCLSVMYSACENQSLSDAPYDMGSLTRE